MKKICINPKNYKLTEGKLYEIFEENDGYIKIINDNQKFVRYDSLLFSEHSEQLEDPITEVQERTEQDCIESIVYIDNLLSYRDLGGNLKEISQPLLHDFNNSFSCGIVRITGINSLCEAIEENDFVNTEENDFIQLKQELFKKVFLVHIGREETKGMWMCSTNDLDEYEDYHSVLDDICTHHSDWFYNPNSGNNIKLWYGIINQE